MIIENIKMKAFANIYKKLKSLFDLEELNSLNLAMQNKGGFILRTDKKKIIGYLFMHYIELFKNKEQGLFIDLLYLKEEFRNTLIWKDISNLIFYYALGSEIYFYMKPEKAYKVRNHLISVENNYYKYKKTRLRNNDNFTKISKFNKEVLS